MIGAGNAAPRPSTTPTTKPHPSTSVPLPGILPGEVGRYHGNVLKTFHCRLPRVHLSKVGDLGWGHILGVGVALWEELFKTLSEEGQMAAYNKNRDRY